MPSRRAGGNGCERVGNVHTTFDKLLTQKGGYAGVLAFMFVTKLPPREGRQLRSLLRGVLPARCQSCWWRRRRGRAAVT